MKQIIYKSLFAICVLMASMMSINAQGSSSEKFVKTHANIAGWIASSMSNDGRYIVLNNANNRLDNIVKLWDTQSNEVTEIGRGCWAYGISDDGKVIAGVFNHPDAVDASGTPKQAHGFHKDGKWNIADYYPGYGLEQGSSQNSVWCISPDGKWMGGYVEVAKQTTGGHYLRPCIWDENGKFVKIFDVEGPKGHMAEARAMSSDGTRVAGFSEISSGEYLKGKWVPTFWTGVNKVVPSSENLSGSFMGMNNSGTIAVGYSGSSGRVDGVIMKDDGTVIKAIDKGYFRGISETGLVVGKKVIYSEELGYWETKDFFKDLHGLDVEALASFEGAVSAEAVSDNGEYICITIQGRSYVPALVRVAGYPLPTIPNKVSLMGGQNTSINISWEAPRFNGYTPIGYNVYRKGEKININLITTMVFNDPSPEIGKNCYTVSAVFKYTENGKELISEKTEEQCVEVIGEDGCFSPKGLIAEIEYNRTVNLAWKSPYPNYKSSRLLEGEEHELVKIKPNMVKSFGFDRCISITSDSEYIYGLNTSRPTAISKFTLDGKLSSTFLLGSSVDLFKGLTYDGTKYYTTTGNRIVAVPEIKIGCTESSDMELTITEGIGKFTRITYLPSLDNNKGGFEVGEFKSDMSSEGTSHYLTKEFAKIEGGGIKPADATIMGVTSYRDVIYVARRESKLSTDMKIFLYNATTNEPTGEYIDLRDYTNLQIGADDQIWGIHAMNSSEEIPCLAIIFGTSKGTRLAFLELANMDGLIGYNVFRNNVKINTEPITNSYYTEKLFDANSYEYKVTALFDGDCESIKSDPVNVTISPIGVVNEPRNINTEIVRNNVIVSWEAPKSSIIPKLIGYNLFKNGVQINPKGEHITDLFYTDKDLALGKYKYEVNAFYNNSGESVKISNTTNLAGFNPTWAPTELVALQETRGDVDLTWKTPAIGDYEIKSWSNGNIEDCIGVSEEGGILYVASKWDAKDLNSVFDYTLSDIEFYAGEALSYTFYIYVGDKLVGTQTMERVNAMDHNLMKLTIPITIEKGKALMVACKVTHAPGELPMGVSLRNNAIGKGDLISIDGKTWVSVFESEKFIATWAISIRLMPYTLESPKEIVGVAMETNTNKNIKIVGGERMMRGKAKTAVLKNHEVTGYNVYKNDEKINTEIISTESFKDESVDFTKNNCYSIEALFTADRKSPKSAKTCTFGHCLMPQLSGQIKDGYPELVLSTPTTTVENDELKFYDGESVNSMVIAGDTPYYVLIKYTPAEIEAFDRYKVTSINAFITAKCPVSLFIKQGDDVILDQAIKMADIAVGEMNEFKINSEIIIDGSKSLMIGLKVKSDQSPIGIDAGPGANYKGDIISYNAINLISIKESSYGKVDANWIIGATIEKVTTLKEKNIGYNIYRDDVKINKDIITDRVYVDKTTEANTTYQYHATALWNTGCESEASEKVVIGLVGVNDIASTNIKIYPNPVKDILIIEGEYEIVRLYNAVGQKCFMQNAEGGKLSINVSNWAKGIYVIEATSATGAVRRDKVIIK